MALGDIILSAQIQYINFNTRKEVYWRQAIYSFTAAQAAAGERLICWSRPWKYRKHSCHTVNEDPAVNVTVRLYASNHPTRLSAPGDIRRYSKLIGSAVVNAGTNLDHATTLSALGGVDYHKILTRYQYLYVTATVGGITTADTMSFHGTEEA